jgi:hypothetical protein
VYTDREKTMVPGHRTHHLQFQDSFWDLGTYSMQIRGATLCHPKRKRITKSKHFLKANSKYLEQIREGKGMGLGA